MIRMRSSSRNLSRISESVSYMSKIRACRYGTQAAQEVFESSDKSLINDEPMDWDNLGFGLVPTDHMYTMKCPKDRSFEEGRVVPYGNIELSPSAGVLNYGQGLFEGMKAFRREGGGIFLFRPEENAMRMQIGAERMCVPCPSINQFVDSVKITALANKRWIPPAGKGTLYLRPLLIGTGEILGLAPASEYTFLVYASPVGNYFKEGKAPLNLYVEEEFHRAMHGGAGGVKTISNYSPVLKALTRAKSRGFSDVLYLDSRDKRCIEEVSSCNIFVVKGKLVSTPARNGNILEGVTRKSIMDIARDLGFKVEERSIPVEDLIDADEVFCTGTAVGVAPVGSITYKDKRVEYTMSGPLVSTELYTRLSDFQRGVIKDNKGWIVQID